MTWQPASVTSQSPKIHFLIPCSIKFSVVITLNVSSGCFSEFSCGISCGIFCGTFGWFPKLCRCFVDLRFQRTGSATM